MLDESVLDSPEALARADSRGLLRGTAEAGARVRTSVRSASESGLAGLRPEGRPRAVFVAGPGTATACAAELLATFGNGVVPVTRLRPTGSLAAPGALRWTLPGWAGSLDLLLVTTPEGTEPGLTALIEQAYRRGCTVVTLSPGGSPVAETTGETHGLAVPLAPPPVGGGFPGGYEPPHLPDTPHGPHGPGPEGAAGPAAGHPQPEGSQAGAAPGLLWTLLTPLLVLSDRLGLVDAPDAALEALAGRLDQVAERCGPAVAAYSNPAKSLAAELSGSVPLLWSEGPLADAVARHGASTLAALPGLPALAAGLPEAMAAHGALLTGSLAAGSDPDDFFRDRVEEPEPLHARILLLRYGVPSAESAASAARELAYAHDVPLGELEPTEGSGPLEAAAELAATVDFAAVYLALSEGGAPSPP